MRVVTMRSSDTTLVSSRYISQIGRRRELIAANAGKSDVDQICIRHGQGFGKAFFFPR